jgi:hypothetical protein
MIASHLTSERGLGRITPETDVDRLAVMLVGDTHVLGVGSPDRPAEAPELRGLVSAALADRASARSPPVATSPPRPARPPRRTRPDR